MSNWLRNYLNNKKKDYKISHCNHEFSFYPNKLDGIKALWVCLKCGFEFGGTWEMIGKGNE